MDIVILFERDRVLHQPIYSFISSEDLQYDTIRKSDVGSIDSVVGSRFSSRLGVRRGDRLTRAA
jgi:hypothetical protein